MPLPRVAASIASTASPALPAAAGRLLFVSYSHDDARPYAEDGLRYLRLMVQNAPELGYAEEDIFFDQRRLRAGDAWDEQIMQALERATALVFLLSDYSLSSPYCMERELGMARMRGIRIVPVLLCPCPWEKRLIPGDLRGATLDSLHVLPRDGGRVRPVCEWTNAKQAWNTVATQIAEALGAPRQPDVPTFPVAAEAAGTAAAVPPLLPYFCDQVAAEHAFNQGLRRWERCALLVLVKGIPDDRAPQFWARLRHKNLADRAVTRGHQVLEQRPLKWPRGWDGVRPYKSIGTDVLGALSDALSGNQFDIDGPQRLSTRLQELGGVLPLMATLPKEPPRVLGAALRELLRLFEELPEAAPLERLVLTFIVEEEDLIAKPELAKLLKLGAWRRTQIAELKPICPLQPRDVWDWHRNYELSRYCGWTEQELVDRVFGQDKDKASLRFAQFDARLKSLLAVKGNP